MAKELTITGKITLPDDLYEQADLLTGVGTVIREAEQQIGIKLNEPFRFTSDIVVPPKPRAARGSKAKANGATAPASGKKAEQQPSA